MLIKFTIQQYYGDISLEQYLQSIPPKQNKIIILNNLVFPNETGNFSKIVSPLHQFLEKHSIPHVYISLAQISKLLEYKPSNLVSNYPNRLLIFDFQESTLQVDQSKMNILLNVFSQIYIKNVNAQPIIVTFKVPANQLFKFANESNSLKLLPKLFRAVLVSQIPGGASATVHIHPILNGCHQIEGIFMPKSESDFTNLKMPFTKCNLNGVSLNVSASHWLPYCDIVKKPSGQLVLKFSMEGELIKELEDKFNFTINLIDGNNSWGIRRNGSWTGMMKKVIEGSSDLGICGFSITRNRLRFSDFSRFISQDEVIFMMQKPGLSKRDWIATEPFPQDIWLPLFGSILVLAGMIHLTEPQVKSVILKLFGIFINQCRCIYDFNQLN